MLDRAAEQWRVPVGEALEPAVEREGDAADGAGAAPSLLAVEFGVGIVPDTREHRVERERHEERDGDGEGDGNAELEEDLADHPTHEGDRDEHRDDREGGREDGEPDLVGAFFRGAMVILPHRDMADDVLAHDDRIVDQQADREGEREQRHGVEREPEHPHREEARDDRHREGETGDHGGAPRVQEQVDDHHGEERAEHEGELDVGERIADLARVVADDLERDVGRELSHQVVDDDADLVGHFDRVGAGDLEHLERERGVIAHQRGAAPLGGAVDHLAHVADADRGAVADDDGDVAERERVGDASSDPHQPFGVAALDAARGDLLILALQRGDDLRRGDTVGAECCGLELDTDLARCAANDVHAADARDRLDPLADDLLGEVGELTHRTRLALHRDAHDRPVVRVEPDDHGLVDVTRELAADAGDLPLHLGLHLHHVDAEVELQSDHRRPLGGGRGDLLQPLGGVERFLDRLGDLALHHLG